uniref:Uncharacterized protein n=1 Tax=viral metagenome TaxID=1070528 RepID=A0A6C0DV78_9ZZZZ
MLYYNMQYNNIKIKKYVIKLNYLTNKKYLYIV